MSYTIPLHNLTRSDLPAAGGKGANLGALIQAGLPVPPGFCITTSAYQEFVQSNGLQPEIFRLVTNCNPQDPAGLENTSTAIRSLFDQSRVPSQVNAAILSGYAQMSQSAGPLPVAVRSSATAEDLPDLSFAGQQDTFLNIIGEQALLNAVVRCWSSLWTGRAIGYRARNQISQVDIALAVVVQQMVPSRASGVLFTANPLTGKRDETVIDATLGLGEALVSGKVEPDHYVVDASRGSITSKTLGAKALAVYGQPGGGVQTIQQQAAGEQALPDELIVHLAQLGQQAAEFFGSPQDMEWAWDGERLYVVQSRPITSLYPLPEDAAPEPLEVYFSFAVWQGMLDPYTPLGSDVFKGLIAGVGNRLGASLTPRNQRVLLSAGMRLFVNITGLFKHPAGRRILNLFVEAIDPASAEVFKSLKNDPRLAPGSIRMKPITFLRVLRGGAPPILGNVLYNLLFPARGRRRIERKVKEALEELKEHSSAVHDLPQAGAMLEKTTVQMPARLLGIMLPPVIAGQIPLQQLLRLSRDVQGGEELVMDITRGLPHNVTTEMDLGLWEISRRIKADSESENLVRTTSAPDLAASFQTGSLPAAAQMAVSDFMLSYGMRGIAEIDFGRPRWRENPTQVFQMLKSYLQIETGPASPEAVFRSGAERAGQAQARLVAALRRARFGWIKAHLAAAMAHRIRELTGLRETPKFTVIRILGILRSMVMEQGQRQVAAGVFSQAEDIFFLHMWELVDFGQYRIPEVQALIRERRQLYQRELVRKRTPRLILSDGMSYYDASQAPAGENVLTGAPVSAGIVEGTAHVVFDPLSEQLEPGEILVCPATDPAWTPLFLAAGGLVMEVGGMMTHGSVVAREYGIPAVVGVNRATTRLKTGQRLRVDGSTGRIDIL